MRAPRLQPAELKNGFYTKPAALLEPEQLWCGLREVWTPSHGRATRYHVMIDHGAAACRAKDGWEHRGVITLCHLIPITKVSAHMCCLRNGCRQLYEAFLAC